MTPGILRNHQSRVKGAILMPAFVSIKRDVGRFVLAFRPRCRPVEGWIEQECSLPGFPFDPGMGSSIACSQLADDESRVASTISLQLLIKRDRLTLAVAHHLRIHFGLRLPSTRVAVRHRPQSDHPLV